MLARRSVIELLIQQSMAFAVVSQIKLAERIATANALAWPDARKIDGAMTDVMQRVARTVLRDDLPVRRDDPFLYAADDLNFPIPRVPWAEADAQCICSPAEIFLERRRLRIPCRPDRSFESGHLRHLHQTPF